MNKEQLEEESGTILGREHTCERNEIPDHLKVYRVIAIEGEAQTHWELFSLWLANEGDVESGEAETVGELLNLSSIKVNYCPFCGLSLE
ncbi:hypothetical protein G8770_21180 [Aestuariicella hydrocarbonica]|uniref:Uncharacterized protein n=1 Tax=Pseudomaricurvus hydrocarbonicus TaxID=1470433 RepID=A0A9E5MPN9_9GAMM|nr:hypothetical protein [Aestuariicella hydrocarbonica]NHO68069.1 hypothetical protein [Aestuariicella hydrocarbonica]